MHRSKPKNKRLSVITRFMLRSSVGRRFDGLWIGSFDTDAELALQRVEEALTLIKIYDPLRYKRLLHDLERIWVMVIPGGLAQFDESIWACVLDPRLLNEANSTEQIASSIIHEATHARLCHRGIGYDEKELRARVETACMRRERAFAGKLPNGEQNRRRIDRYLEFYANPEQWTEEALRVRYKKGAAETIAYLGFPRWLVKLAGPVRSLRSKLNRLAGGFAPS